MIIRISSVAENRKARAFLQRRKSLRGPINPSHVQHVFLPVPLKNGRQFRRIFGSQHNVVHSEIDEMTAESVGTRQLQRRFPEEPVNAGKYCDPFNPCSSSSKATMTGIGSFGAQVPCQLSRTAVPAALSPRREIPALPISEHRQLSLWESCQGGQRHCDDYRRTLHLDFVSQFLKLFCDVAGRVRSTLGARSTPLMRNRAADTAGCECARQQPEGAAEERRRDNNQWQQRCIEPHVHAWSSYVEPEKNAKVHLDDASSPH